MKYLNIKEDKVSIRERLERGSPNIGTLNKGDIIKELVSIVREGEVWYQIETRDNIIGYIKGFSAFRIKLVQLIPFYADDRENAYGFNEEIIILYTNPSFESITDEKIRLGQMCWIMEEIENNEGEWYKIRLHNKKEYYIEKWRLFEERIADASMISFQTPIHGIIALIAVILIVLLICITPNLITDDYISFAILLGLFIIFSLLFIFGSKIMNLIFRFKI